MANGYIIAATGDRNIALGVAPGFDLEFCEISGDQDAVVAQLAAAPGVCIVLSVAAAQDEAYVALLQRLSGALARVQLLLVTPDAREAFAFLPADWPAMALEQAVAEVGGTTAPEHDETPPTSQDAEGTTPGQAVDQPEPTTGEEAQEQELERAEPETPEPAPTIGGELSTESHEQERERFEPEAPPVSAGESEKLEDFGAVDDTLAGGAPSEPPQSVDETERAITLEPTPAAPPTYQEPQAPPATKPEPLPQAPAPVQTRGGEDVDAAKPTAPARRQRAEARASAPADATAFAPKKLRRGTPELVRIVIHQPSDLPAVIKAARKIDPRTAPAPQGMSIGEVALGASVGVALEVRGGACDGALQRRTWSGDAIDFNFSLEADADVKQVVILARVFVDDAQIGVIGFTRPVTGATKPQPTGDKARLKRHKRVFLSYSSKDRETVSAIATAYEAAGVAHFWDRTSLKSGEEWHPRLRREIDRADLFHLCWSRDASASQWVERETEYALTRRRRANSKKPDITVQMLDGPPWAPHPPSLDSINFDDFVRAAIVGYARGDGGGD